MHPDAVQMDEKWCAWRRAADTMDDLGICKILGEIDFFEQIACDVSTGSAALAAGSPEATLWSSVIV